jgi:hypothetical protein
VLLAIVCVLGTGARAFHLGIPASRNPAEGYIFDEHYYVSAARVIAGIPTTKGEAYAGASPSGTDPNGEHPQLGKIAIAAGIKLLGDNTSGWRISAVLFGAAAILLMYWFVRCAGGGQWLALGSGALASADNLWLVHSRIAVLDIYVVPFMLAGAAFYLLRRPIVAGVVIGIGCCFKEFGSYTVFVLLLLELMRALRWLWDRRRARSAAGAESAASAARAVGPPGGQGAAGQSPADAGGATPSGRTPDRGESAAVPTGGAGLPGAETPGGAPAGGAGASEAGAAAGGGAGGSEAGAAAAGGGGGSEAGAGGARVAGRSRAVLRAIGRPVTLVCVTGLTYFTVLTVIDTITTPYSGGHRVDRNQASICDVALIWSDACNHFAFMNRYAGRLRDHGRPRGIATYPTDFWINKKAISYFKVTRTVTVSGKAPTMTALIWFRGEISRVLLITSWFALLLNAWWAIRRRDDLSFVVVAWALGTWLPPELFNLFGDRTTYLYYMVVTMPALYLAVARFLGAWRITRWLIAPWAVLLLYDAANLYPFRTLSGS